MSDFISELFDKNVTYLVSLGCIMGLIFGLTGYPLSILSGICIHVDKDYKWNSRVE